jgi:hypothetical protein
MLMEKFVEVLGENLPQCRIVHHKPHTLPGEKPATNRLSYATANKRFLRGSMETLVTGIGYFRDLSESLEPNKRVLLRIGHDSSLQNSLQSTVHQSFYHSTFHS